MDKTNFSEPTASLVIDVADEQDGEALHILLNQCTDAMAAQGMQHWLGVYSKQAIIDNLQQKDVYLLRRDNALLGCVALSENPADYYADCWPQAPAANFYLTQLAVAPHYQSQGLGKFLVQFCQQQIPSGKTLQLDAVAHYPVLLAFYLQLGFQQIAEGVGLGDKRFLFTWSAE